jgi:hypothetical protein
VLHRPIETASLKFLACVQKARRLWRIILFRAWFWLARLVQSGGALLFGSEALTSKILFPPFSPRLRTLHIAGIPGRLIIIIEPCAYIYRADGMGK